MANCPAWWNKICQLPHNDGTPPSWGWTYQTWVEARRYCRFSNVSLNTFSLMTQAEAGQLAEEFFWNRLGGLWLDTGIDVCVVDWEWNSGYAAGYDIQRHLLADGEIKIDGIIGKISSRALNELGPPLETCQKITDLRVAFLKDCGFTEKYDPGNPENRPMPGLFNRARFCLTIAKELLGHE